MVDETTQTEDPAPQGSTRKRAKERMKRVAQNLRRANLILGDVHSVYEPREKMLGEALTNIITIVAMAEEMVEDIDRHI